MNQAPKWLRMKFHNAIICEKEVTHDDDDDDDDDPQWIRTRKKKERNRNRKLAKFFCFLSIDRRKKFLCWLFWGVLLVMMMIELQITLIGEWRSFFLPPPLPLFLSFYLSFLLSLFLSSSRGSSSTLSASCVEEAEMLFLMPSPLEMLLPCILVFSWVKAAE